MQKTEPRYAVTEAALKMIEYRGLINENASVLLSGCLRIFTAQ